MQFFESTQIVVREVFLDKMKDLKWNLLASFYTLWNCLHGPILLVTVLAVSFS